MRYSHELSPRTARHELPAGAYRPINSNLPQNTRQDEPAGCHFYALSLTSMGVSFGWPKTLTNRAHLTKNA